MQVRCIRARVGVEVGEIVDVPDGAEVSDLYFEPVSDGRAGSVQPPSVSPGQPGPGDRAQPPSVVADVALKGGAV